MKFSLTSTLATTWLLPSVQSFTLSPKLTTSPTTTSLQALSLNLEKPFGLVLEETDGDGGGVQVEDVNSGGSAAICGIDLIGRKIMSVAGNDVSGLMFDDVMDQIITAESPVDVEFDGPESLKVGTGVSITVVQEGKDTITFDAKVGDNLRKALLDNKIEVYRGMKKKLGNCGGGGQCTFCAVDVQEENWFPRSEYEDTKIPKLPPSARLACLNNIQGPATVRVE